MSNVRKLSDYRPPLEVVERKVAQLEDGFLRLANELLDATMCSGLPETELCVVMAVWRKTYGFSKKMDWISNEQLEGMIGKHLTHCSTAKTSLVRKKVLIQEGRKVGMNTNISEWETKNNGFCKTLAKPAKKTLAEVANGPSHKLLTTKDNIQKTKDNTPLTPQGEEMDEIKIQECWNEIAIKKNYVKSLGLADSIKRHLRRNFTAYLKHCKKIKKDQPKSITEFSCTYLSRGFAGWATGHHSGENDRKWRADIEFAVRKSTFEKIFYSGD